MTNPPAHAATILESLVHHLTLPPRLPGREDATLDKIEPALITYLLNATSRLDSSGDLECLRRCLRTCKVVNAGRKLHKSSLLTAFRELQAGEFLILHVVEQNSALIIRRDHEERSNNILFEAFEASPLSEDVLASKNALQWDFPGCAVAIPISVFEKPSFQDELAIFLEKASTESIKQFAAKTTKAGSFAWESRDSVDPSLITGMLLTLLEVNGTRIYPTLLRKRVRDDVSWDRAENPWRRAPFWLVLRVAIQRHLSQVFDGKVGRVRYKFMVCLVLVQLLDEALHHLSLELLVHVKAKLCRRLVKLEVEKERVPTKDRVLYESMFESLQPSFLRSTTMASNYIDNEWSRFKKSIQRPVLPLPRHADKRHLYLTLPNSANYIQEILMRPMPRHSAPLLQDHDVSAAVTKPGTAFASRYFSLSRIENEIEKNSQAKPEQVDSSEKRCIDIAEEIERYLAASMGAYSLNPEQNSIFLLTVMDLWMSLDETAMEFFPLLKAYNPGFPPEILDTLQLSRFSDMCRLQKIRKYLQKRNGECKGPHRTIFDDPAKGCFTERYYDESNDSFKLAKLHKFIETASEQAKLRKEQEWEERCLEYDDLVRKIAKTSHLYTVDELEVKVHAERQCTRCFLERKERRFRMRAHEHFLPEDTVQAKAVVFELGCPQALVAYRDMTWRIMATLAFPTLVTGHEPLVVLQEYSELRDFSHSINSSFSLASVTKSFLKTHYADPRFPASLADVCLPNGLKFKYYDTSLKIWPGSQSHKATFAQHCQLALPKTSPLSSLQFSPEFAVDGPGPSSYQIVASQTKCPSGMNIHEFMAFQTLFSGKIRRWPQILVELGSTNLNFSTEPTVLLLNMLALQVGPAHEGDPLGAIHSIFKEAQFCHRLLEQLDKRIDTISSNYRETNCMEMIITLILRLSFLAADVSTESAQLLEKARNITFRWLIVLRSEVQAATDSDTSLRCSRYAIWSALLCRRTFATYADQNELLEPTALQCFIECSITLQDTLTGDPAALPNPLRNAYIRDLKMVHRMRYLLRRSLQANPDSLILSITAVWPDAESGSSRTYSRFEFLDEPDPWWVKVTIDPTSQTMEQTVHFNLLEGHLLVMGKPIGKLPAEHRTSAVLQQLFGNQSLLTYPSSLPGMTYRLAVIMYGHQIHLGFRHGSLVIRALVGNTILELIPLDAFGTLRNFDLPAALVMNCVHWLDLKTRIIEIRQQPNIWRSKDSNWFLDFNSRFASRYVSHRTSTLVDPHSPLFSRVARIFDKFEYPHHLTVYQPQTGPLSVELRRMELSFVVNIRNLLESRQLQAEIVTDQDCGTWYGLNSKIVMKEIVLRRDPNTKKISHSEPGRQKSIIVPLGDIMYKCFGPHIAINVANNADYGKYTINEVLKRLDCPAEPRLLYSKALLHAYTSFILPDPLTGRTGTEEALHCLRSGYCQPWSPLTNNSRKTLELLAHLTPRREYYPQNLKVMQITRWDLQLTTIMQNDEFRAVVEGIQAKSELLSVFATHKDEIDPPEWGGERHLTLRSQSRRETYQRPNASSDGQQSFVDLEYIARDRWHSSLKLSNVVSSTSLIRDWPSKMSTSLDLAKVLQEWASICGYNGSFDKMLLTDLLNVQFDMHWGPLINLCRNSHPEDAYRLMFLFGIMSFRHDVDMEVVRTLIAFALLADLKVLHLPKWPNYSQYRHNQVPRLEYLVKLVESCLTPYGGDDRSTFGFALDPRLRRKLEKAELAHKKQQDKDAKAIGEFLLRQWPCSEPTIKEFSMPVLVDMAGAMEIIRPEWQRLYQNWEFSQHIDQVQSVLETHRAEARIVPPIVAEEQEVMPTRARGGEYPTLTQTLLRKSMFNSKQDIAITESDRVLLNGYATSALTLMSNGTSQLSTSAKRGIPQLAQEVTELGRIIDGFTSSKSTVRQQYGNDLKQSLVSLRSLKSAPVIEARVIDQAHLSATIVKARCMVQDKFDQLQKSFEGEDARVPWLQQGGLWAIITPVTLLENLRSNSNCIFGKDMKEGIVSYALSITALQRLIRIQDALQNSNSQKVTEEQQNIGHDNWKPQDQTDWLLFEIDANVLIRPAQVDVTLATISPSSRSNSVLQMNMGQGKTSCIMPMAAAILANGENLHRVIVPKPLLLQTAQLLHARLGGLLGREIRHIPFSRKTPTDLKTIEAFQSIHRNIQEAHGVMIALPEHLLSFALSGLQRLSDGRTNEAKTMIQVQDWLASKARDVLDECDSILAIRTQLIYPSGSQTTVDGHPHRWEIVEALLNRVDGHLWKLQNDYPQSIEVVKRPQGGFPIVFFLRKDVEDQLTARLVDDIISHGRILNLPSNCTKADLLIIKEFISEAKVTSKVARSIHQIHPDKPAIKQAIHLLRGLFVHRILLMTLKKRWNVQYGLHPGRDPIAVPYTAKGIPSDQAEWGHPDVAILFTCLAFYYDGLNVSQLRQILEHVLKSDDPSQAYDRFSYESGLPDSLRDWNSINVDDDAQLREIWRHLRYSVVVIDYFLNNFAFPRHAKQFQMKLQASGWDIPLAPIHDPSNRVEAENWSKSLTTGFSGTNDWKRMLPLTINQHDLPALAHTNAEVLSYLLQPRNRGYVLVADPHGRHISEIRLLEIVTSMKIRVLIDAGAQILEMTNYALVKVWLEISPQAPAAVFFDEKNRPMVVYRQGHLVPLLASPYADDLGECLVYLDQAHTRGTDLKFPANARGALTLGPGQTKDHTVQAAMRLRQLGTSQAVVFFAPPEVHQSILDTCKYKSRQPINSYDVICWLVEQTCSGIEQLQPLYYSQGADFCRRVQAVLDNQNFLVDADHRNAYLKSLRQIEQQTLEQLYGLSTKQKSSTAAGNFSPTVAAFMKELNIRRKGFQDNGTAVQGSALQEVEQEREVAYEVEAVREVQKPVHYQPHGFPGLHKDIVSFARTGRLAAGSTAWVEAFVALGKATALGRKHVINSNATSCNLYVSYQFTRTVNAPLDRPHDQFQRSVNWILFSIVTDIALIVIPEEAEYLIPLVRRTENSCTNLLTYAAPVTRKMLHFNNFHYYSIPSFPKGWEAPMWLRIELGIFAGRLYFDHLEYRNLLQYLGVSENTSRLEKQEDEQHGFQSGDMDGASEMAIRDDKTREVKTFTRKPLSFLQEWLATRRKGQDFAQTPMGFVCQDKPLLESHPFFARQEVSREKTGPVEVKRFGTLGTSDEEDEVEEAFMDDEYGVDVGVDEKDAFDDAQLKDEKRDTDSESDD